jgi:protocatechuate 3,4-dioxygenase beta subunit
MLRSSVLLFVLFFSFVLLPRAQNLASSNQTGSVRGTVMDTRTGQPLAGASVTVRGAWGTQGRSSASTGPDGIFSLRSLPAGRYRIEASQPGYVNASRSGFRGFSPTAVVVLSEGQHVDDIVIRLAPAGSIAGRIVNGSEQSLTGILVSAMKASYRDGHREFSAGHTAFTDDHGEFRITGLGPGHYFIKATAPRGWEKGPAPAQVYVPVFYPGVTDPAQTQPLDLRPGDELSAINLTLNLQHAVHVKGRILNSNGRPAKGAEVSLSQLPASGYTIEAEADAAGKFDIAAVPPGSYLLESQVSQDSDPTGRTFIGRATVSVAEANVDVPDLTAYPGATVSGHVRADSDRKISFGRTRITLKPASSSDGGDVAGTIVQPDGSFEFSDVAEGNYRIELSSAPDGFYRKGSEDGSDAGIVVSHGHAPAVEIRLDAGAAQIQGAIYSDGENQQPAPGASVILIPDASRRSNSENYRFGVADRSGKFVLRSIPPGEYLILAFEEMERDAAMNPDFIREYEDAGKTIRVEQGGNLTLDLQTTPQ